MRFLKILAILSVLFLTACVGNMNPTGGNSVPDYPYFITKKPMVIKKVAVPAGTRLVYEEQFFKEGEQDQMLREAKLTSIKLPEGKTIDWAGVPVTSIDKFFNSELHGFSVVADFEKLSEDKKTKFSELWESCSDDLGITVRNTDDWSFNPENIQDVESCSVLYQRYFKDDLEQKKFLDAIYMALKEAGK